MTKTIILICAGIFGVAGAYLPYLWGDTELLSGWSILFSTIGGLFGIWVGVMVNRKIGL